MILVLMSNGWLIIQKSKSSDFMLNNRVLFGALLFIKGVENNSCMPLKNTVTVVSDYKVLSPFKFGTLYYTTYIHVVSNLQTVSFFCRCRDKRVKAQRSL